MMTGGNGIITAAIAIVVGMIASIAVITVHDQEADSFSLNPHWIHICSSAKQGNLFFKNNNSPLTRWLGSTLKQQLCQKYIKHFVLSFTKFFFIRIQAIQKRICLRNGLALLLLLGATADIWLMDLDQIFFLSN